MNRLALTFLAMLLFGMTYAQPQQRQLLPGRYFTSDTLLSQLKSPATEKSAQFYLMGVYDLTQDSGQSCAVRGTTTPLELEQIFSQYLQTHPELMHADRTAAGVAGQAFAEYWPCPKHQSTSSPTSETDAQIDPQLASLSESSVNIAIQVKDAFGMPSGFGLVYRTNVEMPKEFTDNNGHWSFTCDRLLSHGSYTGTYDPQKNKIKLLGTDMKGKPQATKCQVFTHDWRAPTRR
jgi:hypothetical protein